MSWLIRIILGTLILILGSILATAYLAGMGYGSWVWIAADTVLIAFGGYLLLSG